MDFKDQLELAQLAKKLEQTDKEVVKSLVESTHDLFIEKFAQFFEIKKDIRKRLVEFHTVTIDDDEARRILERVHDDEPFSTDKMASVMKRDTQQDLDFDHLNEYEFDEMRDVLYSWFSHYEYVDGLYDIGSLILGI